MTAAPRESAPDPLLRVRDLTVDLTAPSGTVRAADRVSFDVGAGEAVGLVGESGAGKSVTALALLRLTPASARLSGQVLFDGQDLLTAPDTALRAVRGRTLSMIFQQPRESLNPVLSVGTQLTEVLRTHLGLDRRTARRHAVELLRSLGLPGAEGRAYPHQYSGGMCQRVAIAMALACGPRLLVADEPTTALDVTVQAQILDLLTTQVRDRGTALLLISHDLGVIAGMTSRVMVMYAGRVVEVAPTDALFAEPRHPYTAGLLRSVPRLDRPRPRRVPAIPGQPPTSAQVQGCAFADRCLAVTAECRRHAPPLLPVGPDRSSACWHWRSAPDVQAVAP